MWGLPRQSCFMKLPDREGESRLSAALFARRPLKATIVTEDCWGGIMVNAKFLVVSVFILLRLVLWQAPASSLITLRSVLTRTPSTSAATCSAPFPAHSSTARVLLSASSVLSGGPVVTTAFGGILPNGSSDGPFAPRGVDNYATGTNEGFFIGISNAAFGRVNMCRIANPDGVPIISADIPITVSSTSFPITVDHLGDTGGTGGNLDALDDRLFAAHIRNGRMWTSHNIAVLDTGVASGTNAQRRDAVRWYELVVPPTTGTPTVNQTGTTSTTRSRWPPLGSTLFRPYSETLFRSVASQKPSEVRPAFASVGN